MKLFVFTMALVVLASGLPQQGRQQGRQAKQLANYGAPEVAEASAPAAVAYGAPEGEQADESAPAPALYGSPAGEAESRAEADQATYNNADGQDSLLPEASELDSRQLGEGAGEGGAGGDPIAMLRDSVPGTPGEDYPIYAEAPETKFTCDDRVNGGYYADPEAECQAFHICTADGQGGLAKYSFLCPNGTIFNQEYFICDWWFNVDCSKAEALATSRNAELESARSEADSRLAADSGNLDAAASGVSEAVAGYGAPTKSADDSLATYAEDSNDAESSDLVPISTYGGASN